MYVHIAYYYVGYIMYVHAYNIQGNAPSLPLSPASSSTSWSHRTHHQHHPPPPVWPTSSSAPRNPLSPRQIVCSGSSMPLPIIDGIVKITHGAVYQFKTNGCKNKSQTWRIGCTKKHCFQKQIRPNPPSISLGVSLKESKRIFDFDKV